MKFGKALATLLDETFPEWRDKFLSYKPLKKLLKKLSPSRPSFSAAVDASPGNQEPTDQPSSDLQEWFIRILTLELDKLNDFYVKKEEDFVIRFRELKRRIEQVKEKTRNRSGVLTSESEFSEEMMDMRKDFVRIHGQMVLLKSYSSLNFTGFIKILKKYDKRTGGTLQLPFIQLVLHQPFYIIEPLTRLVHECEADLELLFPLQAEVIESTSNGGGHPRQPFDNAAQGLPLASEEILDIYRSTLAAISTIRGIQTTSSTYNRFSFPSLFRSGDDESTGAVTEENSAANSPDMSQNREYADEDEDVHSD